MHLANVSIRKIRGILMIPKKTVFRKDMIFCSLCQDPPCNSACPHLNPGDALFDIWFLNEDIAASKLPDPFPCASCDAPCERACLKSGEVPIKKLMCLLEETVAPQVEIPVPENEDRLRCDICGVPLENPFILGSSVVASSYDMCARALDAGWAGVSYKTICSFPIHETSPRFSAIKGDTGKIIGFKNIEQLSDRSVEENMEIIRRLKKNYPTKVIIASIMGQSEEEWESLARQCQENGADVIELNFSCPNMQVGGLGSDIGQIPELVEKFTRSARRGCSIPLLAKLTPNVAKMSPAAEAAKRGGADGLAAINTIKSVIDFNPYTYYEYMTAAERSAVGGYSGRAVKPIGLRFIAEMGHNKNLQGMHISAMGGVETWNDALDYILLGASSIQVVTAVMLYGYRIIDELKAGLNYRLAQAGRQNIRDIVGLGLDKLDDNTEALERDTIIFPMFDTDKCNGCGRCVISCSDGGHQAIRFEDRKPKLDGQKCVGCHLCLLVCPERAIIPGSKRITRYPKPKT